MTKVREQRGKRREEIRFRLSAISRFSLFLYTSIAVRIVPLPRRGGSHGQIPSPPSHALSRIEIVSSPSPPPPPRPPPQTAKKGVCAPLKTRVLPQAGKKRDSTFPHTAKLEGLPEIVPDIHATIIMETPLYLHKLLANSRCRRRLQM